jgi:hypothetical protein
MPTAQTFKNLVHYICWKCSDEPTALGSVKLNKALWLSDLIAYYRLGHPITNARYVKRQYGPVPSSILPVLRELQQSGVLTVQEADHFGRRKREFLVHKSANGGFLSPEELAIVDRTIAYVCDEHTAVSISEASHDHIWKAADDGEIIPHFTVFAEPGKITEEDREWAQLMLENSQ